MHRCLDAVRNPPTTAAAHPCYRLLPPSMAHRHGAPSTAQRHRLPPAAGVRRPPPPSPAVRRRRSPPAHTRANLTITQGDNQSIMNQSINQSIKPAIILLIDPSKKRKLLIQSTAQPPQPITGNHIKTLIPYNVHISMCTCILLYYFLLAYCIYVYIYICTHRQYDFSPVRFIADPSRFHIIHRFENGDFILCAMVCPLSG